MGDNGLASDRDSIVGLKCRRAVLAHFLDARDGCSRRDGAALKWRAGAKSQKRQASSEQDFHSRVEYNHSRREGIPRLGMDEAGVDHRLAACNRWWGCKLQFWRRQAWSIEGAMMATALNPLVFVGLPLALYWWSRAASGFACPKCGRRNAWTHEDVRRLAEGKKVQCLCCSCVYRVPPPA